MTSVYIPAARFASEFCIIIDPRKTRAQGMPARQSHQQPCVQWKKARKQVTLVTPKRSGIPRATRFVQRAIIRVRPTFRDDRPLAGPGWAEKKHISEKRKWNVFRGGSA
jgi:hypothetical protein